MTKQFLLRAHSSVFTMLPIFAKCTEKLSPTDGTGHERGQVRLNTIGRAAALAAATMVAVVVVVVVIITIITTTMMTIK